MARQFIVRAFRVRRAVWPLEGSEKTYHTERPSIVTDDAGVAVGEDSNVQAPDDQADDELGGVYAQLEFGNKIRIKFEVVEHVGDRLCSVSDGEEVVDELPTQRLWRGRGFCRCERGPSPWLWSGRI